MRPIKVMMFIRDENELSFFSLSSSLASLDLALSSSDLPTGVVLSGGVVVVVVVGTGPAESVTTVSMTLVGEAVRFLPLPSSFSSFILSNIACTNNQITLYA